MGSNVPMKHLLIFLLLFSTACAWYGPAPAATVGGIQPYGNVLAMDRAVWRLVAAGSLRETRSTDNRLGVELELHNLSTMDLSVQVRTVFRDKDGMPTNEQANWQMLVLPRGDSLLYESRSLTEGAQAYTIQIRSP